MREFVSGDEISEVDVVLLLDALDETDALRIRHGIGKRLRKTAIAWKFHDAQLLKLVGTEVGLEIIQSRFAGRKHVVQVVFVPRNVINLQSDPFVLLPANLVLRRQVW